MWPKKGHTETSKRSWDTLSSPLSQHHTFRRKSSTPSFSLRSKGVRLHISHSKFKDFRLRAGFLKMQPHRVCIHETHRTVASREAFLNRVHEHSVQLTIWGSVQRKQAKSPVSSLPLERVCLQTYKLMPGDPASSLASIQGLDEILPGAHGSRWALPLPTAFNSLHW